VVALSRVGEQPLPSKLYEYRVDSNLTMVDWFRHYVQYA